MLQRVLFVLWAVILMAACSDRGPGDLIIWHTESDPETHAVLDDIGEQLEALWDILRKQHIEKRIGRIIGQRQSTKTFAKTKAGQSSHLWISDL